MKLFAHPDMTRLKKHDTIENGYMSCFAGGLRTVYGRGKYTQYVRKLPGDGPFERAGFAGSVLHDLAERRH